MISQSRIWGAREEALSGLEGQLEVVGLELMAESIIAACHKTTTMHLNLKEELLYYEI